MVTFLIYQLKVAVIMAVFYIFYRLFLIKDSWHRLNRIVLLSTALLSFLLPVCIITIHKTEVLPMPVAQLMQAVSSTPAQPSVPWWQIALMAVYTTGVVFVLARVLTSVIRVRSIIKNARKEFTPDGTQVYIMPGNAASFSWMGHIVISEADWNNNESAIIRHEKAHVALHHSIDVLITDLIAAAQWFNPAIWMLRIDLRAVHEYEADDTVLRAGTDLRSYQYLLISKAAAMNGYTIANNFNHSILKNRIFMMEKERTTKKSLLRALYLLPLVCISLALNAKTKVNYVYDNQDDNTSNPVTITKVKADGDTLKINGVLKYELPDPKSSEDFLKITGVEVNNETGEIKQNGRPVKKVLINGKEADANQMMEFLKGNYDHEQSVNDGNEETIKSVDGNDNVTVNDKSVRKILVNGKEYFSDAQSPIYANDIVDEVEGKTPEGYSRNIMVNVDKNTDQVSITSEDKPDSKWNATAYRIPEGTNIEELIQNLPGVETDADGNITVNGKRISRVLVNGEELNSNKTEQAAPTSNTTKSIDDNGNITIDTQNGTRVNLNGTQVTK